MTLRQTALLLLLPALLSACDRGPGESAERRASRIAAERNDCVAEELLIRARENLAAIDTLAAASGGAQGTLGAAHQYARAYHQLAQLRASAMAYTDSAMSAATAADSARYMARAAAYVPRAPQPGTVEANVQNEWQRRFAELRSNPLHYCNQEPPEGGRAKE